MKYPRLPAWLLFFIGIFFLQATVSCDKTEVSLPGSPPDDLSSFIEEHMEDWDIPGMAVAVVHQDSVVFAEGFGVSGLEEPLTVGEPDARPAARETGRLMSVDEHTLFGVASISKSFTAAALGLLVQEGRIHWDDPVIDYLPGFELYDPWVTESLTIRDALTHRSGLGRMIGNRLRFMTNRDRDELIYRLRYLDPEKPFRHGYVYNNMMYLVAGHIIPAVTGQSWDAFVEERLFGPLDMRRSNTSITQIVDGENAAWPHQEIRGEVKPIPRRNFDNAGPAASINTTVTELAQWVRLHLGVPGAYNGERLIDESVIQELHTAQTTIPANEMYGDPGAYGMGWFIERYRGERIDRHGGGTDGFTTSLILMPGQDLGIIIVTNTFSDFREVVANKIMDHYLGLDETAWNQIIRDRYEREFREQMAKRDSIHALRQDQIAPSLPLDHFTGDYYDNLYGELEVMKGDDDRLLLRLWENEEMTADLEHWEGDRFRAAWHNPAQREKFVQFVLGRRAVVEGIEVTFNLRPNMLQVGAYPSDYTRTVMFDKVN